MDPPSTSQRNVLFCVTCGVACSGYSTYQAHLNGKKHLRRSRAQNNVSQCPICEIVVHDGARGWSRHILGRRHGSLARRQGISPEVAPEGAGASVKGHMFCAVCKTYIPEQLWDRHPTSLPHQRRLRSGAIEAALEEAAKDKHGIAVSNYPSGLDFGFLEPAEALSTMQGTLTVQNTVPMSNVVLSSVKLSSAYSNRSSSAFSVVFGQPAAVTYGRALQLSVSFSRSLRGIYADRVEMYFEDMLLHQKFTISRSLKAVVGEKASYDALQPKTPYVPRKRTARAVEAVVIAGEAPPALDAIPYIIKLPKAGIPDRMLPVFSIQSSVANMVKQVKELLPQRLDSSSYGQYYKTLLWAEEYRSDQDLQIYDVEGTTLKKHNMLYYLPVPGLAEKRPSVLVGDSILIQPTSADIEKGTWFDGRVHVVHKEEVGMKFGASFHAGYSPAQQYRARFKLNRYPLRRQHQALDTAFTPDRILFPAPAIATAPNTASLGNLAGVIHNQLLIQNPPQLQAVTSIVSLPPGSPTFIVFGPPGTGKTVTIVEAIRQILDRDPNARILACAPSNSAADLIALRLNMLSPDELEKYTATNRDGHFTVPSMMRLKRFRVIVSTCVSASFAYGIGMPRGHFTHIFFDEAGHATETEIMIAVKTMADNNTNVILSGDHKQLGPIIRSAAARQLGLETSYLERLMDREGYDIASHYGVSVVNLVQNFRSHPQILQFPNEQFYNSTLQPCGDPAVINSYLGSSVLVNKKFPIVFRALAGKDDREANSPSFFNVMEALEVKAYVEKLRSDRQIRTRDQDVAVIAPYHAQCQRIRTLLRPIAEDIKVGSVEELQGQERRVIIISTVRSSREFVEYDIRHTLGFVANPRRLNVAVTRAQALLIIVGDPDVLGLDPLWRDFLNFIHRNGGWEGDEPRWDTSAPVSQDAKYDEEAREAGFAESRDFAERMESTMLYTVEGEVEEEDNADRPWRDVE